MKSSKEIIVELVDVIAEAVSGQMNASTMMLKPALNVVKLKMAQMSEADSADILDKVHFLSHRIECESGRLSPYHGIEEYSENITQAKFLQESHNASILFQHFDND